MDFNLATLKDLFSPENVPQPVVDAAAQLDTAQLFAVAAALGWASGLRLYAVVFLTGLAGYLGWVPLPHGLQVLSHPLVMGVAGLMMGIEFAADKVPVIDSAWDTVQTVLRIPAGAALAAAVFGADAPTWALAAGLMGGTLATTAHAAKSTTRAAVNTSPEPFSNIGLSLVDDAVAPLMLWLSWEHPVAFAIVLAIAIVVSLVLIVTLYKFLRAVLRSLRRRFGGAPPATASP